MPTNSRSFGPAGVIALGLLLAVQAQGMQRLAIPLTLPAAYLQARAAEHLGMGQGSAEMIADDCNRLRLSQLRLNPGAQGLTLQLELDADLGLDLFGGCRGAASWGGALQLRLVPALDPAGDAILFSAESAELRQRDGDNSLLTAPSRLLADKLVLPRLEALRVDVTPSLSEIDTLVARFLDDPDAATSSLGERGRLTAVGTDDRGLALTLQLSLRDRPPLATATEAEAVLGGAELAEWQRLEDELDGFLSQLLLALAAGTDSRDLQLDFMALLIDARLQIAEALQFAGPADVDPVRTLFLDSWGQLSELAQQLPMDSLDDAGALRLAVFLSAGDALTVVDALGPQYGIEVSADGLRRLARLLLSEQAPISFTPLPLAPDPALQKLLGFGDTALPPPVVPAPPLSWLRRLSPVAPALATAEDPAVLLRTWMPDPDRLDSYLGTVAEVIEQNLAVHTKDSRLSVEQLALFEPLVRATAWKETCWRHYVLREEALVVIRSGVGAVGMMQIVGRVWRSVFDLERLESDVSYNLLAGMNILEHYFLDYAVRRGEHRQPGGDLVRATYSAYNGGPSRLSRYRNDSAPARARAVDEQFFLTYQAMREAPWPTDSRCYGG
jgi:hypothetical protein